MQLIPKCSRKPSKLTKRQIQSLESEGFLQKHLIRWRCALGHESPFEETEELTTFKSFFKCGFEIPTSDFFRGILNFYQIELYHLTPNSILHISIFIHLCEAYLGIDPHFHLFRHFFRLKAIPDDNNPKVVGGALFQFRQGTKNKYIPYSTQDLSKSDWHRDWFYVANHLPKLGPRTRHPPVKMVQQSSPLNKNDETQILDLLELIKGVREKGLTGAWVYISFLRRRIQPIKQRCTPGYLYQRANEPSCNLPEEFPTSRALLYTKKYLGVSTSPEVVAEYFIGNPPPEVNIMSSLRSSCP